MKSVDTLVEDIYNVLQQGVPEELEDNTIEDFGRGLSALLASRLSRDKQPNYLRMSNLGSPCQRKLWYSINEPEAAIPLRGDTLLKFLIGDVIEAVMLFLSKAAGHEVTREQDTVELHGVTGHMDAIIDGAVVDVKSAAPLSFAKFAHGLTEKDDAFGYLTQIDAYLHATNTEEGAFLAVNKVSGAIALDKHTKSMLDYKGKVEEVNQMLAQPKPPRRAFAPEPDGKSGNMKLGTVCSYCEFRKHCYPGLRTFLYSSGPRFLTTVAREPDVPEVYD